MTVSISSNRARDVCHRLCPLRGHDYVILQPHAPKILGQGVTEVTVQNFGSVEFLFFVW